MAKKQADWRHVTMGALLLLLLLAGLWKVTLGSPPSNPTAPAPAGKQPLSASPDSP